MSKTKAKAAFATLCLSSLALVATTGGSTAGAADACPNEALREEQHATYLPNCRAYEMVSPLDKNGADVVSDGSTTFAATDGESVLYAAKAGFADMEGAGQIGLTQYLARRGAGSWSTHSITPLNATGDEQIFSGTKAVQFATDLSAVGLMGNDLPQATGDLPLVENVYTMDTETGALSTGTTFLATDPLPLGVKISGVVQMLDSSDDVSVLAFSSKYNFKPEVSGTTEQKLYAHVNGTTEVAGVLPNGSIPIQGAGAVRKNGGTQQDTWHGDEVSSDGSRIFFRSPTTGANPPQIYVRKNLTSTDWITQTERVPSAGQALKVVFQWASDDGRKVLFTTGTPLTNSDTGSGEALYLYTEGPNPSAEANLTFLFRLNSAGDPLAVSGATEDAGRIYFTGATGVGHGGPSGGEGLYVWDHGTITFIAPIRGAELGSDNPQNELRINADGSRVAFRSEGEVTGDQLERDDTVPSDDFQQTYLYDLPTDSVVCASCVSGGVTRFGSNASPKATKSSAVLFLASIRPSFLSEDGRHVFIDTRSTLLPEDTNGVEDVYDYHPDDGSIHLITSGLDSNPSGFIGASSSGDDVFVATREQLTGHDTDALVDLYDVRVDGGYPEPVPQPAPCVGDGCREAPSTPPAAAGAGSATLVGAGNARATRKPTTKPRCRKASKKTKRRCTRKKQSRRHSASRPGRADQGGRG